MPLQESIHRWTAGGAARRLNLAVVFLGVIGLAVWYHLAAFKNLSTIEGLDAAQLARNIADGRGYTTGFIRPFSMSLLRQHHFDPAAYAPPDTPHPDLANAPLYPVLLAGALRLMPFPYPDVAGDKSTTAYAPDRWVAGFNQLLFIVVVIQVFRLGSRLFDPRVGWLSAAVVAGTELLWRFAVAGLPTILAMVLVMGLAEVLARGATVPAPGTDPRRADRFLRWLALGGLAGGLTGLAGLTRYSLGWLIGPVLIFWAALPAGRRGACLVGTAVGFLAVMAPWVVRNHQLCGSLFGTAGFAVYEGTQTFPGFELLRTWNVDFSLVSLSDLWVKLGVGLKEIIEQEFPRLGGHWVAAFFLVGLLISYRAPVLNRLRYFVVGALVTMALTQALGRTGLSADSPLVNGENLLVVFAPLVLMFGVAMFQTMADQWAARDPRLRRLATGFLLVVGSAPLLISLARMESSVPGLGSYEPGRIQEKAGQLGEQDWLMTDVPWAVAWYGARASVWLSLRFKEPREVRKPNDFAAISGAGRKPVRALYLSGRWCRSVATAGMSSWIQRAKREDWELGLSEWESFLVAGVYAEMQVPTGFPLKDAPFGLWPELFLMDSERAAPKTIKGE